MRRLEVQARLGNHEHPWVEQQGLDPASRGGAVGLVTAAAADTWYYVCSAYLFAGTACGSCSFSWKSARSAVSKCAGDAASTRLSDAPLHIGTTQECDAAGECVVVEKSYPPSLEREKLCLNFSILASSEGRSECSTAKSTRSPEDSLLLLDGAAAPLAESATFPFASR